MWSKGQDLGQFSGPDVIYVYIPRSHTPHGSAYWEDVTEPNREDYVFHVEYNHMHDYGLGILSDFGAVYIGLSLICRDVCKLADDVNALSSFAMLWRDASSTKSWCITMLT